MNNLTINKESKKVEYTYTTEMFKFTGTCQLDINNVIEEVQSEVRLIQDDRSIGNCSSNSNSSVNIWDGNYKSYIDVIATSFKALQDEIIAQYTI